MPTPSPQSHNQYKDLFHYLVTYLRYRVVGSTIRLEASTLCQLKCPVCPTGKGEMGVIGKGYLKLADFIEFIKEYPFVQEIELSNYGEIFLNPELNEILKYAYEKNIRLTANNGVNLNNAREEVLEDLVKYRFKGFFVALDGASDETYKIYRQRGNFDNVITNIKKINFYKEKYKSSHPLLTWQFVVFGHNEHEIQKAKEFARELNMSFVLKKNWSPQYAPIQSHESMNGQDASQKGSSLVTPINKNRPYCKQLWLSPQINWDGKLLGCCINNTVSFGNVMEEGLGKCMKNKKYRYMQEMLLGRREPKEDLPCYTCSEFKDRQAVYDRLKVFRNPLTLLWTYAPVNLKFNLLSFNLTDIIKNSWKRIVSATDRNIGRVGIFLKKHSPALYQILAKIIKRNNIPPS